MQAESSQSVVEGGPTVDMATEAKVRSRATLLVSGIITAVAVVGIQVTHDGSARHWIATGLLGATSAHSFIRRWAIGVGKSEVRPDIPLTGLMTTGCVFAVLMHVGVFSPMSAALVMIVYFFGTWDARRAGWIVFAFVFVGYAVTAVLAFNGLVPLSGSWDVRTTRQPAEIALVFAFEGLLIATLAISRFSRRATLQAIRRLEHAHHEIRQRDALLHEAYAALNQAAAAGRRGRFTGQEVGGYLVGEIIGRGAAGEVYRARHIDSGGGAALKLLHPHVVEQEPTQVDRFLREAEASSAVASPHVVRVLARGQALDETPFIAMELLEGQDLARYVRKRGRLDFGEALTLVTHVAEGLASVAEAGIVHRDLKPQNLFRHDENGRVTWKILDFGVSKVATSGALTAEGAVGTPDYMSPEQVEGSAVDHRADLFALALIAYRVLTGRPAFSAPDTLATMYQVRHLQPSAPSDHVHVHADVDRVFAIALAKDREERFSSATSFVAALRDGLAGRLDQRFRDSATALLAAHPWGTEDSAR